MQLNTHCVVYNNRNKNSLITFQIIKMKIHTTFYYLMVLCLTLLSCNIDSIRVDGNDEVIYKDYNYSNYDTIEIVNDFNAYVRFSETEERIEIEANENLYKYIIVRYKDNKLKVGLKKNTSISGIPILNVYITTKSILKYKASSDARIYLKNKLIAKNVYIKLSSDSRFYGSLEVDNLEFSSSSDAKAELLGSVNYLNANLSSDSKILDYDLEVAHLKIKLSSDSKAHLSVTNTIDVNASSDAVLFYRGDATIIYQNINSDAKVVKVD